MSDVRWFARYSKGVFFGHSIIGRGLDLLLLFTFC